MLYTKNQCMESKNNDPLLKKKRKVFDKRVLRKAVQDVEDGVPRSEVLLTYSMCENTLGVALKRYGSEHYHQSKRASISKLTKNSVVAAVQTGRMTIDQATMACNVKDPATIRMWIKTAQYQQEELIAVNCAPMPKPGKQKTPLELENERLKKQLEYVQLQLLAVNTLIDVAEKQLKISIRKKPGAKQ